MDHGFPESHLSDINVRRWSSADVRGDHRVSIDLMSFTVLGCSELPPGGNDPTWKRKNPMFRLI